MTTNNSLDALLEEADGVAQEVSTDFSVTDLASADWCLRKVAAAERRMQARRALVEKRIAELQDWEIQANKADLGTTERMAEYLQPWAEHEVAQSGGKQSVSLPTGTVGFRRAPDSIEVLNTARAVESLKQNGLGHMVRVKEEVDKRALMEHLKNGGLMPEDVELRQGERRFYLKVNE